MFDVVAGRRRRSMWTPRAVAVSLAAHLLLLVGALATAAENMRPAQPAKDSTVVFPVPATKVAAASRNPVAPRPAHDESRLASADPIPAPFLPPATPVMDPMFSRLAEPSGNGSAGEVPGPPSSDPRPAGGSADPQPEPCDGGPCVPEAVTVLPRLSNARDAERLLQHLYPPLLRDAGVTGRTIVVLIIDREGNVEPGSVRVQETTHPGFADAAIRAAEKMRFTPAQLDGRAVSVVIAIPIDWQLQN